ncbi:MAG: methylisocitrate lyase [Pseudomonadota bacterium]
MNWLTGAAQSAAGDRFRHLLSRGGLLPLPGVYNGLAALQARAQGFEALYLSGAALSASMGLPDLGILTIDDVCHAIRQITRATGLPLLVDGDTGYGEPLNVMHMVRSFEDAGAAAVHLEDQRLPKKCGHLNDKLLVPPQEMAERIAAAIRARRHLYVIARTDAAASEGLAGAIARARLYLEAGADAVFPEALENVEQFSEFARAIRAPLLFNMTEFGRTPQLTTPQIAELGYAMVIWPVSALRVAARAQEQLYATLQRDGSAAAQIDVMQTRKELYATLGYSDYEALDASLAQQSVRNSFPR